MLKEILEKIWWRLPYIFRVKFIRFFQQKFTASVVAVVTNEEDQILVMDHFFRPRFSWGLPGGFLDADETPAEGLRRELYEEAEIELENVRLENLRVTGSHMEIMFSARGKGEANVNSHEIRDLGWFAIEKLPEMSDAQVHFISTVLARQSAR